jgi:predicted RNase H-like HicB family nuclease
MTGIRLLREGVTLPRYLIIIEKATGNFSAYSPDLPGCVATGKTRAAAEKNIKKAIEMHIRNLKRDNLPLPESRSSAEYVNIR